MHLRPIICAAFIAIIVQPLCAGENWPAWRGPTGDGLSDEKNLPIEWDAPSGRNILWKTSILPAQAKPDQNQSSPIVWGKRVFITVSYWPQNANPKDYPEHHLLCFDTDTGGKLWDTRITPGPWKLSDLRGGYTAPTPATDGTHIYAAFGSSVIAAVDFQGNIVWRKEIKPYAFDVAWAASPVLFSPRPLGDGPGVSGFPSVIAVCDQKGDGSMIYAFDGKTGDIRWQTKRPKAGWAHSTPLLAKVGDKLQLVTAAFNGPQALDPATGDILWTYTDSKQIGDTVTPTYRDGRLYVDTGRGGGGICIDVTGAGDISKTPPLWKTNLGGEAFSSPVLFGDYLYRMSGGGALACYRWKDGQLAFKERLDGADSAVSPFAAADGRLYVASAGRSYVLKAGAKVDVLAVNTIGDASRASPAVAAGRIYLKGREFLWCVGASKKDQAKK